MKPTNVFVHVRLFDGWDNFTHDFKYLPHKGDRFSTLADGPIYEVEYTLINAFDCDCEVEIYSHQINP